ncbi:MAG: hypothetical protein O2779_05135 [Nanoarchaeota archaeon]|nr:hypothetical protein [Nanoarchaeota archaeon]
MSIKEGILFGVIMFAIIIFGLWFFQKTGEYYTDNPQTWVIEEAGASFVSIEDITKGDSFQSSVGQQYHSAFAEAVFDSEGLYQGITFKHNYYDENKNLIMSITPELDPNNGIIEGFIAERMNETGAEFIIFLDEDWKQKIGDTYLFWGKNYEQQKQFEFTQLKPGIYMQRVPDDLDRFSEDFQVHSGGIMVGDLSEEKRATRDENITVMMMS